jgi:DNA-binding LacI/PurR family transcriptional regulator
LLPVNVGLDFSGRSWTIGLVYPLYESQVAALDIKLLSTASQIINEAQYAFLPWTHLKDAADNLERFLQSGLVDGFILMQIQLQDPRAAAVAQDHLAGTSTCAILLIRTKWARTDPDLQSSSVVGG